MDRAQVLSDMGVAYAMLDQLERAITCVEEALAVRPDFDQARANLARPESAVSWTSRPRDTTGSVH